MKLQITLILILCAGMAVGMNYCHVPVSYAQSENMTFYPDAHIEQTSVDGIATYSVASPGGTWSSILAGAGNAFDDSGDALHLGYFRSWTAAWRQNTRANILIDINDLPEDATINAVILKLYGYDKGDGLLTSPDINIYSANPNSNIEIKDADYATAKYGSTPYSSTITYENFKATNPFWNSFVFNAYGIEKTQEAADGDGILKLGIRSPTYDVNGSTPNLVANQMCWMSVYSSDKGEGYKPTLIIYYETPGLPNPPTNFNIEDYGGYSANLTWEKGTDAVNTLIKVKRGQYPENIADGQLVYFGTSDTVVASGMSLMTTRYFFRAWGEKAGEYSENFTDNFVGGETVNITMEQIPPIEVTMDFPFAFYAFIFGMVLLMIAFFIKSPFISLAVWCAMLVVILEPKFANTWFQYGAACIFAWAMVATVKRFMDWRTD